MAEDAAIEENGQQGRTIDLSPGAKMGIMMSLRAARTTFVSHATIPQLTPAGPDYAYLEEKWSFFASTDGQQYLRSDELRVTLEALLGDGFEAALEAAFDESREQMVFRRTYPHPEFLRRLVERFVESENPRSLRRILLISEGDLPKATSASFHLPQAYDSSFPCSHCTAYRTENETDLFVEVFHFPNRNDPSVCATVSFCMPADQDTNNFTTSDSRVEMFLTEGCRPPSSPFARPRKLFTQFDTCYAVLREVNSDGLEKLQAVSRGWCAIINRHRIALPRRKLIVDVDFNGQERSVVTVVMSRWNGEYEEVLRVLLSHSPEQLSRMLRVHLRDALVKLGFFRCKHSFLDPPPDAIQRCDQPTTLGWAIRLFQSLKHIQVERVMLGCFGIDNLPALMRVARSSCQVGTFDMVQHSSDAFTVPQVVDLLRDPTAVASDKIVVRAWFPTSTDYSPLEDVLFSRATPAFKLILYASDDMPFPPTTILTLPARHNRYGNEVTTRVHVYRNTHTKEVLSAVRHVDDTHDTRILFLKGHVALDDLRNKWTNDKY